MAKINLSKLDTRAPGRAGKEKLKLETRKYLGQIEELQNLLFAESKHAVLIVLQGMDASGKDGAIRNVFSSVNPMGCRVIAFKRPTDMEMRHDFLWRIHQQVPEKGMIHLFNRSHYEDVVIQRVHHWVEEKTIRMRYDQINDFEKLLIQNGTLVMKFYLHISKTEQLKRLKERLSDPTKMWKHNRDDLKERDYWIDYMDAYEQAFIHCSTHAAWHVVPSDQNWYKEYLISKKVLEALQGLRMKYPGLKKGQ